ncbi:MAG: hypothetical protein IJG57_00105 [Firmicutes bacterium]|nr:hypothetical protein [Bacillota bacterium]
MAVERDESFWKLVEEWKEEAYQRMYKEKFTQVYWITYQINGGDEDKAIEEAEEEAFDYAEYMMKVIEDEIIEDVEEFLEDLQEIE